MRKNIVIIGVALILVVGFGSFYVGMKYGQSKNGMAKFSTKQLQNLSPEQKQQMFQQTRDGGNFQGGQKKGTGVQKGMAFLNGEILNKDDKSITIKLMNGGSQIVFFTASTTIGKVTEGVNADLEIGKQVTINGATGSGGSVVAQSIQIRPNELTL